MKIFHKLDDIPHDFGPSFVTVGNFDGLHCAHRTVLDEIARRAKSANGVSVVVTFEPHPVRILRPDQSFKLLTPTPEKIRLFETTTVDAVLLLPFTRDLSLMTPHQFAHEILKRRLHAREIHEGYNFHFGRKAAGNIQVLRELGREMGFEVHEYPEMRLRGERVSSSHIRKLLAEEGRVSRARHLLGRPFSILSFPGRGRGYGAKYTVPTINLARYEELVPKDGVYITRTRIGRLQTSRDALQLVSRVGFGKGTAFTGSPERPPLAFWGKGVPFAIARDAALAAEGRSSNPREQVLEQAVEAAPTKASTRPSSDSQTGECFDSVTNVGNRPTFGPDSFAIESHLLNFHPIALTADTEVEIHFLKRLRDEIKFPSVEALKEQIGRDVRKAQKYFRRLGNPSPHPVSRITES